MKGSGNHGQDLSCVVNTLGAPAARVFRRASSLTIMAVFSRSVYLRDGGDGIVCLVGADLPVGPLNAVCEPGAALAAMPVGGVLVKTSPGHFTGHGVLVTVDSPAIWVPEPWPTLREERLRAGLSALFSLAARHAPVESPARILAAGAGGEGGERGSELDRLIVAEVERGAVALYGWLRADAGPVPGDVLDLLGLGRGLTPTGDDILAGALLALRAVGWQEHADHLGRAVTDAAGHRTNLISAAHLAASAAGLATEPVHRILADILLGGDNLPQLVEGIHRIGHTSGWDAVLGIAIALDAALAALAGGGSLLPFLRGTVGG